MRRGFVSSSKHAHRIAIKVGRPILVMLIVTLSTMSDAAHVESDNYLATQLIGVWVSATDKEIAVERAARLYVEERFERGGKGEAAIHSGSPCGKVVSARDFVWHIHDGFLVSEDENGKVTRDEVLSVDKQSMVIKSLTGEAERRVRGAPC